MNIFSFSSLLNSLQSSLFYSSRAFITLQTSLIDCYKISIIFPLLFSLLTATVTLTYNMKIPSTSQTFNFMTIILTHRISKQILLLRICFNLFLGTFNVACTCTINLKDGEENFISRVEKLNEGGH